MEAISEDTLWMHRALELAQHGLGTTSPNPPVGAVIVKDGRLLGEGWHEQAGSLHAERKALENAHIRGNDGKLAGATIYITLEPCSTWGRTPPCTDAIIQAGIKRVVYGAVDPDERHRGRADALLAAQGIDVQGGCCESACGHLLRPWAYSVSHKRPWVLAKVACTMDGRMTRRDARWLSSDESIRYAHQLRLESDAILVGGNTVRRDNPALTIRRPNSPVPPMKKQPWRLVLTTGKDTLPPSSQVLTDAYADRTLVEENVADFTALLEMLYHERGIVNLMLECGGRLLRRFLEEGLVNEWVQIMTPTITGGPDPLLPGAFLATERRFELEDLIPSGRDTIFRGIIH